MDLLPSIAPRPGCRKNTGVSAMDSSAALHLRGAGPIFLRPVIRNPVRVVRWSAWLASEAAAPRSVLPLKPRRIDLGMRFILFVVMHGRGEGRGRGRGKSKCGTCQGCKRRKGCDGKATTAVTPLKNLEWSLDSGAEFRSPSETKAVPLSVRSSIVTGSDKKAKPNEKQMLDPLDPKVGGQSQLKLLEAKMKEQMQQLQSQVTGPASVFVCTRL